MNGRYRIRGTLGKGGMGFVYKAADATFGTVAIKEFRPARLSPSELLAAQPSFEQEVQILRELTGRGGGNCHIPTFYDAFSVPLGNEMRSYLVMEWIDGKTLQHMIDEAPQQRLSQESVPGYATQLCEVLSYLHGQKPPVIFRDLKPSNVMIDQRGHVFLIDFGIARYLSPEPLVDTFLFGTPGYAPPELFTKTRTEPRSDLFSLGATLHYCLTGQRPRGPQKRDPFKFSPVRDYNPDVSLSLDALIMRLVATKEEDRPANAAEVAQELLDMTIPTQHANSLPTAQPIPPAPHIQTNNRAAFIQAATTLPRPGRPGRTPYEETTVPNSPGQYYDAATAQAGRLLHELAHKINTSPTFRAADILRELVSSLSVSLLPFPVLLLAWLRYNFLPRCIQLGKDAIQSAGRGYAYVTHPAQHIATSPPAPSPLQHPGTSIRQPAANSQQARLPRPKLTWLVLPAILLILAAALLNAPIPSHPLLLLVSLALALGLFLTYVLQESGVCVLLAPALLLTLLSSIVLLSQPDTAQYLTAIINLAATPDASHWFTTIILLLLLSGILYCWFKRGRLLLLNYLLLIFTIFISLSFASLYRQPILQSLGGISALPLDAATNAALAASASHSGRGIEVHEAGTHLFSLLTFSIDNVLLPLVLLSTLLHLARPNTFNKDPFKVLGTVLAAGKVLYLALCLLISILTSLTFLHANDWSNLALWWNGSWGGYAQQPPFPFSFLYLFYLAAALILILITLVRKFSPRQQLYPRGIPDHERPFAEFNSTDYMVMFSVASFSLLVWITATQARQALPVQPLWTLFVPGPLPLWISNAAWLVVTAVFLLWPHPPQQPTKLLPLRVLLSGALLCFGLALLSAASTMPQISHFLQQFTALLPVLGLPLLSGGIILAVLNEMNRLQASRSN